MSVYENGVDRVRVGIAANLRLLARNSVKERTPVCLTRPLRIATKIISSCVMTVYTDSLRVSQLAGTLVQHCLYA
jgi:hypothetical protein